MDILILNPKQWSGLKAKALFLTLLAVIGLLFGCQQKSESAAHCFTPSKTIARSIQRNLRPPDLATGVTAMRAWRVDDSTILVAGEIEGSDILVGKDDIGVWVISPANKGGIASANLEAITHSTFPTYVEKGDTRSDPEGSKEVVGCVRAAL